MRTIAIVGLISIISLSILYDFNLNDLHEVNLGLSSSNSLIHFKIQQAIYSIIKSGDSVGIEKRNEIVNSLSHLIKSRFEDFERIDSNKLKTLESGLISMIETIFEVNNENDIEISQISESYFLLMSLGVNFTDFSIDSVADFYGYSIDILVNILKYMGFAILGFVIVKSCLGKKNDT